MLAGTSTELILNENLYNSILNFEYFFRKIVKIFSLGDQHG